MTIYRNGIPEADAEQVTIQVLLAHTWQPRTWRPRQGECKCGWSQGSTGKLNHPVHVAQKLAAAGILQRLQAYTDDMRINAELDRAIAMLNDQDRRLIAWYARFLASQTASRS